MGIWWGCGDIVGHGNTLQIITFNMTNGCIWTWAPFQDQPQSASRGASVITVVSTESNGWGLFFFLREGVQQLNKRLGRGGCQANFSTCTLHVCIFRNRRTIWSSGCFEKGTGYDVIAALILLAAQDSLISQRQQFTDSSPIGAKSLMQAVAELLLS